MRRQAIEITVIFLALLGTVGAFGIWWGGTSAPARPIASGLLLLMLPIAAAFRAAPIGSPRRAAQHLLLWISIGIAITLTVSEDGLLINNARDGTSALLGFWSPRWELWTLAPDVRRARWTTARLQTALVAGVAFARRIRAGAGARPHAPGTSALVAAGTLAAALIAIAMTMPLLPAEPPLASRRSRRAIAAHGAGWLRRARAAGVDGL